MSSAGMSGTGDTDKTDPLGMRGESNWNGQPSEIDVTGSAPLGTDPTLGEMPPDMVEVVEVVTTSNADIPSDMLEGMDLYPGEGTAGTRGFRWQYVPMAVVPLAAGGAAFWYARRQKTPPRALYDTLSRRSGDALGYLREQTKRAPQSASALRDRSAATLSALAATDVASRAQERLLAARDMTRGQLSRAKPTTSSSRTSASASLRENLAGQFTELSDVVGPMVAGWLATLPMRRKQQQQMPLFQRRGTVSQMRKQLMRGKDKVPTGTVAAATTKATAKATKSIAPLAAKATVAGVKTRGAVRETGKSVNSAWKRTRTFTFALLVGAMVTYVSIWRRRMAEREMRETAAGRLEPDREPTFSR